MLTFLLYYDIVLYIFYLSNTNNMSKLKIKPFVGTSATGPLEEKPSTPQSAVTSSLITNNKNRLFTILAEAQKRECSEVSKALEVAGEIEGNQAGSQEELTDFDELSPDDVLAEEKVTYTSNSLAAEEEELE